METQVKRVVLAVTVVAASLFMFSASAAQAGPTRHHQQRHRARIVPGVQCGALTRTEARVLRRHQRVINHARAHALADGYIGWRETRRLKRAQYRAGNRIYRLKHNRWTVDN